MESSFVINWVTGCLYSMALGLQLCCVKDPSTLSYVSLFIFIIANICMIIQSFMINEISLYLPSICQFILIVIITVKKALCRNVLEESGYYIAV